MDDSESLPRRVQQEISDRWSNLTPDDKRTWFILGVMTGLIDVLLGGVSIVVGDWTPIIAALSIQAMLGIGAGVIVLSYAIFPDETD